MEISLTKQFQIEKIRKDFPILGRTVNNKIKICLNCNKDFPIKNFNLKQKMYSRKCAGENYKKHHSGANSKNFGIKKSELHKQRIREAKLGPKNPMFGKNPWNMGVSCSEGIRKKISQTKKERFEKGIIKVWNKGEKTGHIPWNKGETIKTSTKLAESIKKAILSRAENFKNPDKREKFKKKSSESHKKYYESHPEALEKLKEIRSKIVYPKKDTKIELKLQKALESVGIQFKKHYPFYNSNCETRIDIAIPDKKIAIYCDGDYWHNLPSYKKRDIKINKELELNGWKVLRFWEREINSNITICANKIIGNLK